MAGDMPEVHKIPMVSMLYTADELENLKSLDTICTETFRAAEGGAGVVE